MNIEIFPEILTFNLGRFEYDILTYERKKIDSEFKFPIQFNIEDFKGNYEEVWSKIGTNEKDVENLNSL